MKYTARKIRGGKDDGKWAVFIGRQYFTDSIVVNNVDAEIRACEMSAQYYQAQIDKCRVKWEKIHRANGKKDAFEDDAVKGDMMNFDEDWGGIMC